MKDVVGTVSVDGRVKPGHDAPIILPSLVMAGLDPAIHARSASIAAESAPAAAAES